MKSPIQVKGHKRRPPLQYDPEVHRELRWNIEIEKALEQDLAAFAVDLADELAWQRQEFFERLEAA